VGLFTDFYFHPGFYFSDNLVFDFSYVSAERVNMLSISPDVYEELQRISLDPYVAARQAYYEYRRKLINER
jgi:phospholipid-binding lipoprotein MlaA